MKRVLLWTVCGGTLLAASGCGGGGSGPSIPGVRSDAVVFISTRDGHPEIYSMNFDGSNQTRLSNTASTVVGNFSPRLSRDGATIVFSSYRDGNAEIYKMNFDGTGVVRLTNDQLASKPADISPAISPDGGTIAWSTTRGDVANIYLMNSDGSNQRPLAGTGTGATPLTGAATDPSFSPDGKSLVYVGARGGALVLVVRNLATGAENVIDPRADTLLDHPRFNRAGNALIFYSSSSGARQSAYLASINTDGTGLTRYVPAPTAPITGSADSNAKGDTLIFQSNGDNSGTQQIFTAPLTTFGTQQKLTTLGDNSEPATAG